MVGDDGGGGGGGGGGVVVVVVQLVVIMELQASMGVMSEPHALLRRGTSRAKKSSCATTPTASAP